MRVVWVTRTLPEAEATAARLEAKGHRAITAPVLEARPLAVSLDLDGVAALAFTSGHAIAAFARQTAIRDLAVFTVGVATARQARQAGFADVRSADGNVEALADLIADVRPGQVLAPAAAEPTADLARLLAARGVPATSVAVYETVPTTLAGPPRDADAVLIHSARAAVVVAGLIEAANRLDLEAFAISLAAARPLERLGLARLSAAPFPNEAALLDLL